MKQIHSDTLCSLRHDHHRLHWLGLIVAMLAWLIPGLVLAKTTDSANTMSPAKVKKIANEVNFNTITLTAEAERRLNIQTVALARRDILKTHLYGGELILPLTQPLADTAKTSLGGKQSVSTILPLMTPADQIRVAEAQVSADGEVKTAQVQVDAAHLALTRAQRLYRDHAGSRKDLDEAQAQLQLTQTRLDQAKARRQLLGPTILATTPPEKFWIRVPVFVGALSQLDLKRSVQVGPLTNLPEHPRFVANPVIGPPSSNPNAATVDLFYQIDNPQVDWQLGQKIGVALPFRDSQESLIAPWSAVVIDIYGGTWVYERTEPHVYVRRRVQVRFLHQDDAILASGPKEGTMVVAKGAAELFGIEVGFGN